MARPFVVRVGDLLRDPGSRRDVDVSVETDLLATSAARTVETSPVGLRGRLESMPGGLTARGTVSFDWVGECRRCLDEVGGRAEVAFDEVFQRHPVDEDVLPIEDEELLDLEPLVRELVLSGLPLAPLCREDCPGPDPERFPTGAADDEARPDPRWAALADLDLE